MRKREKKIRKEEETGRTEGKFELPRISILERGVKITAKNRCARSIAANG
jgi:hypothetical protein